MCVHVRRDYRAGQLTSASAGGFAAAAVLNALGPADWSVSQEVELAVGGLAAALHSRVPPAEPVTVRVAVHANDIEIVLECEHAAWVTDGVRVRPRRPFESRVECAVDRPAPPSARPALWPELADARGREEWSGTYRALAELMQSGGSDTQAVLETTSRGILSCTCFTAVAINLVTSAGVEVVWVEGDDEGRDALMGVVEPEQHWRTLLWHGSGWGSLRYSGSRDALPTNTSMTAWRRADGTADALGWDPRSTLVAPMYVDGRFLGAISADLAGGAPRPAPADLAKLEAFAEHAAAALERVRATH